jgi:hypothetical protein
MEETLNQIGRESLLLRQSFADAKAIYGPTDDRRNYDSPRVTAAQRRAADATVILVKLSDLTISPDAKSCDLPGGNILDSATGRGLCTPQQAAKLGKPREAFYDEPNPGFCSGFRIAHDRIATAGHCIRTQADCENTRFVFGFYKTVANPHPEKNISMDNVYACKRILGGSEQKNGADWRVVEVDRDMKSGSDLPLRSASTQPKLLPNAGVVVIGYPMGLPVKIAGGASVRSLGNGFFVANLDTYGGNSGSAVFNSARLANGELLVEGILVRGENDFETSDPCFASKWCPTDGCRGEDVTNAIEIVVASVP